MTPQETLRRMTATFSSQQTKGVSAPATEVKAAQTRLAAIMAEVSSTPVEDFFPRARTQPRRDPAQALRWFFLVDALVLCMAFLAAWAVAGVVNVFLLGREAAFLEAMSDVVSPIHFGAIAVGSLLWFVHTGHYARRMPFWLEAQKVITTFGFSMLMHGFMQFATKQDFSRIWLMSGWVFAAVGVVAMRGITRHFLRRAGLWQVRTLLVGSGAMADDARLALRSEPGLGYEIVTQIENLPLILNALSGSWEKLCDRFNADYVVIALEGPDLAASDEAIASLVQSGMPFSIVPPLRHLPVLGMSAQYFFSHDLILMAPVNNLEQPLPRFLKRSMDVVVSGLAIIALSPVFLAVSYLVRKDGGPALFGHKRIGFGGKSFNCLKFRSMILNADEVLKKHLSENAEARTEWNATQKLKNDPRVTKVGDFIRRWSIDELPQLINVFRGDMSLVGPRPVIMAETLRYNNNIQFYYRVRPGLTGLWQVSGRSDISFARRVQMDSWYVRNWSLWHDIAILFKTIPVVLNRTGAY